MTEGGSDPTEFLSDSLQSDSDPDFVGIQQNIIEIRPDPTKTLSNPIGFL